MANFDLDRATQPEACLTGAIEDTPLSLEDFGFDAEMVERSFRAYIYVHDVKLMVKWAQDYPRVVTGDEMDTSGYRPDIVEPPPVPSPADGHGIEPGQEREVIGRRALRNLRMVSTALASGVTITLES